MQNEVEMLSILYGINLELKTGVTSKGQNYIRISNPDFNPIKHKEEPLSQYTGTKGFMSAIIFYDDNSLTLADQQYSLFHPQKKGAPSCPKYEKKTTTSKYYSYEDCKDISKLYMNITRGNRADKFKLNKNNKLIGLTMHYKRKCRIPGLFGMKKETFDTIILSYANRMADNLMCQYDSQHPLVLRGTFKKFILSIIINKFNKLKEKSNGYTGVGIGIARS